MPASPGRPRPRERASPNAKRRQARTAPPLDPVEARRVLQHPDLPAWLAQPRSRALAAAVAPGVFAHTPVVAAQLVETAFAERLEPLLAALAPLAAEERRLSDARREEAAQPPPKPAAPPTPQQGKQRNLEEQWAGGCRLAGHWHQLRLRREEDVVTIKAFQPASGATFETQTRVDGPVLVRDLLGRLTIADGELLVLPPPLFAGMLQGAYVTVARTPAGRVAVSAYHPERGWRQRLELDEPPAQADIRVSARGGLAVGDVQGTPERSTVEDEAEARAARREEAGALQREVQRHRKQHAERLAAALADERRRFQEAAEARAAALAEQRRAQQQEAQAERLAQEEALRQAEAAEQRDRQRAKKADADTRAHLRRGERAVLVCEQARDAAREREQLEEAFKLERERQVAAQRTRLEEDEEARAAAIMREMAAEREAARRERERRAAAVEGARRRAEAAAELRESREKLAREAETFAKLRAGDLVAAVDVLGPDTPEGRELERLRGIERGRALKELAELRERQAAREAAAVLTLQRVARGRRGRRRAAAVRLARRRDDAATVLQARTRGALAVRALQRLRLAHARQFGVMLALPGTTQGFSGFYAHADAPDEVFRFRVDRERDSWERELGPVTREEWRALLAAGEARREAAAVDVQRVWRGCRARARAWRVRFERAQAQGVMCAMPGTRQGHSGWYIAGDGSGITHYTVTPDGLWRANVGPLDQRGYRDELLRRRGQYVPLDGTKLGRSGWYVAPPGEFITFVVYERGRVREALFEPASRHEWAARFKRARASAKPLACPGTVNGDTGYYLDMAGAVRHWSVSAGGKWVELPL